jgi:radical SAM superfamily enzyme YgiQ (UPF0313 family)
MRVAFVNPPYLKMFSRPQRSPAVTKSGTLYFPMWLALAAGYAGQQGHVVDLVDAPASGCGLDAVLERVQRFSPGLVVVETSTPSIYNDVGFCAQLKRRLPGAFVVLVGTHVSALPEESLALGAAVDAVAVGEYDATLVELAAALEAGRGAATVAGLCLRGAPGTARTPARPPIEDLDALPFVSETYRTFLRIEDYFNPNALYPMVTVSTSRGCPFQCTFCVYPQTMMGHRLRLRSVGNVLDELEYIVRAFPRAAAVFFEDDTFAAVKKRCIEIAEGIVARGIKVSWTANARADLDLETMRAMRRSGCRCLCVGFESGSQRLLDNIKKRISVDKMAQFMADARRAGILIHGCFIVGHPGETKETMEQTLALAKRLGPDTVQFYPIMVYPGTEAYAWYRERGLIATEDFSKWLTPSGLHNSVVSSEDVSAEELVRFCDRARREFYLRPSYLLYKLRQTLTRPSEMRRNLKSARTFARHLLRGSDVRGPGC